MCSIWISIGFDPTAEALDAARHRGPDGEGILTFNTRSGPLTLAHKRLSIYDLTTAGAQPMQSSDARYSVVFNGAIYNFREIRAELESRGHHFETRSDTEVLLHLWQAEGERGLQRLNGMFAFAILDAAEQTVTLVRDRFGEKPLHYALWKQDGRPCFAAASEIGQLLAANRQLAVLNRDVAGDFVNFGATDWTDDTFFAGIYRLPAGHVAELDLAKLPEDRSGFAPRRWWNPPAVDPRLSSPDAAAEALRPALESSVRLRLVADVQVGFCLSGGLDSSAIVALAARQPNKPRLTCVTAMFDELTASGTNLSERAFVDAVAETVEIDRVGVIPDDSDVTDALDAVVRCQGEPFASSSVLAQWLVFRAASQAGQKVMLDGQGADELMAGYPGMAGHHLADMVMSGKLSSAWSEIERLAADESDFNLRGLVRSCYSAIMPESTRRTIGKVKGTWPPRLWPASSPLPVLRPGLGRRRLDGLVAQMVSSVSLPSLLRYEDRNSMAFSIESRLPFLDSGVSDIALRAPGSAKIAGGETKRMLRLAVQDIVPELIVRRRRKLGFSSPEQRWLAGPLSEPACQSLRSLPGRTGGFIQSSELDNLLESSATDAGTANMVFRLMSLDLWMAAYGVSA